MNPFSAGIVAGMAEGELVAGRAETPVGEVSTDTRTLVPGALFVALVGERFDGHDFLEAAVRAGAAALMVRRVPENFRAPDELAVIRVDDTQRGLQRLAAAYRRTLALRAVLVTGSNGKTSTKDLIASVLRSRHGVSATRGNLNNHIGLPLTMLRADPSDAFGVWEIGMNHPGEIAPLAAMARPDMGVITNIGTAHIGNMGSRLAIAEEKGALARALPAGGTLFMNAADDFTSFMRERTAAKMILAGFDEGEVRATAVRAGMGGMAFRLEADGESVPVELPVLGRHMVGNALLAAAVGREAGLPLEEIAAALNRASITPGRLQPKTSGGIHFIDDSYNANPDSMRASFEAVSRLPVPGKIFVVLGAMAELGEESAEAHQKVGRLAVSSGFTHVCSVGEGARAYTDALTTQNGQSLHHFADAGQAAAFLKEAARPGDLVLLKGSRTSAMESVYNLFAGEPQKAR